MSWWAFTSLQGKAAELDHAIAQWGEQQPVVVVTRPIEVGDPVEPSVEVASMPTAMIPVGALASIDEGARARYPLVPGEIVVSARLATEETTGLPTGTAGVTLRVDHDLEGVVAGHLVDLWAIDPAHMTSERVAAHVQVLAITARSITVAVNSAAVEQVTLAALGPVVVTRVG